MENKTKEKIASLVSAFSLHNVVNRSTKKIESFDELMAFFYQQSNKQEHK